MGNHGCSVIMFGAASNRAPNNRTNVATTYFRCPQCMRESHRYLELTQRTLDCHASGFNEPVLVPDQFLRKIKTVGSTACFFAMPLHRFTPIFLARAGERVTSYRQCLHVVTSAASDTSPGPAAAIFISCFALISVKTGNGGKRKVVCQISRQ